MEYRSCFELRQQILEDLRAAQCASPKASLQRISSNDVKQYAPLTSSSASGSGGVGGFTIGSSEFGGNISSSGTSSNSSNNNSSAAKNGIFSSAGGNGGCNTSTPFMPSTTLPDDPTLLVREVPGAENLKELSAALEQAEAVQRYMEKGDLSLEESARYIMVNGSTGQKLSFFSHIRSSLESLDHRRISRVLEVLLDSMWTQDPELQCQAPEELLHFLDLVNSSIAGQLLDVTKTMLTVKTAAVREAWCKLLLGLVGSLTWDQIHRHIFPLIAAKVEHAEPQDQRELSCDLLGELCQHIPQAKVEQLIVPRALALCQDTNVGVRQHICQQLGIISRALGVEVAKVKVAPDLFELLNDEERSVSRMAFSCLIDLVEFFGPEFRRERLYPIIKLYVSNPPSDIISVLVSEYGRLLYELRDDIHSNEDTELFAKFYREVSQRADDEMRRNCAFHLPAVVVSLPQSVFVRHLVSCLNRLATDPRVEVRRCIASGLHELVPRVHDNAARHLKTSFFALLGDSDVQVVNVVCKHIDVLLGCFVAQLTDRERTGFFATLAGILQKRVPSNCTNWRGMRCVLHILSTYFDYFDETVCVEMFTPQLLAYMSYGAQLLKRECATLIVRVLRRCSQATTKIQLICRFNNEYARSSSYFKRVIYLYLVREMCDHFSRRCIRERLLECALHLHHDPVVMVRLALARCLVGLSKALRTHNAGNLEDEFAKVVNRLLMDDDGEVRAVMRESSDAMERMERDRLHDTASTQREDELDRCYEREDQAMLEMAKECDKAERRAKLRDMMKLERSKESMESISQGGGMSARRVPGMSNLSNARLRTTVKQSGTTTTTTLPRLPQTKSQLASMSLAQRKRQLG